MAMTADVSRALATFISSQGLGQDAARALADQYGDITAVGALPEWLTEQDSDDGSATRSHSHVLVDGICTNCSPGAFAIGQIELQRTFDPLQLRDPHTGKWSRGGGAAFGPLNQIVGKTLHFKDGDLDVGVDEHGVHLGHGDAGRSNSGGLDRSAAWKLADRLHLAANSEDREHDGEPHAVHSDGGYAHIEEHGPDDIRLQLGADGRQLKLSRKEAGELSDTLYRYGVAKRVDTGYGPLDTFVTDDDKVGFRMKDDHGKPTEVAFDRKDWQKIDSARGHVWQGFEEGTSEDTPDIDDLTVKTSHGPVDVGWRGSREDQDPSGRLVVAPTDGAPWSIVVAGDHMLDFSNALSWIGEATGWNNDSTLSAKQVSRAAHAGDMHVFINGVCITCTPSVERNFNPSEPRIPGGEHGGEWGHGGAVGKALKDALKLDGKIDLGSDEKLVGSDKLLADSGSIRMALTETHGKKSLRLGLGDSSFGSREDEAGPWRGSDKVAEINAERKKLDDEHHSVVSELDKLDAGPNADPERKAALQKRLDRLDELNTSQVAASGYTATIDEAGMQQLHAALTDGLAKGVSHDRRVNGGYNRVEELDTQLGDMNKMPRDAWTPALRDQHAKLLAERQALQKELDAEDWTIFAKGSVPGKEADVHYRVDFDDPSQGVGVQLAAVPHDSGLTFEDLASEAIDARLDEAETKKFLRQLQSFAVAPTG